MITPDADIVLYAYNEDAPQHAKAKQWLEEQFSSPVVFGLSWQVITAFLRISTNPRAFPQPFDLPEAIAIVDEWISLPNIEILTPTANHWTVFQSLILEGQTKAAIMMASRGVGNRTRRDTRLDRPRFLKVLKSENNQSFINQLC